MHAPSAAFLTNANPKPGSVAQESIPTGTLLSPRSGLEKKADSMLLPREEEMQHNTTMIMNRFLFCLTSVRFEAFRAGFVELWLDLCLSRTIRVRQNAASCVFYMSLDHDVMEQFGRPSCQTMVAQILNVFSSTQDLLVRLTIIRTLKQLTKLDTNLDGFYNAGLIDL